MNREPTLSIYTSHDRELLFHGNYDECKAAGITVRWDAREVVLHGVARKIVNQHIESNGSAGLWVI